MPAPSNRDEDRRASWFTLLDRREMSSWLDHSIAARLKIGPIGVVVGRTIPGIDHDEHQLAGAGHRPTHGARLFRPS